MNRGDIVVAAGPGDAGKPRPWIVLRSDRFSAHHRVTLLPLTSEVRDEPFLRVDVAPSADNGLRVPSQAMVDRSASVSVGRIGGVIGRLTAADMPALGGARPIDLMDTMEGQALVSTTLAQLQSGAYA